MGASMSLVPGRGEGKKGGQGEGRGKKGKQAEGSI